MPTQYSVVEFPVGDGIDRKTDARKLQPGKLTRAENVVLTDGGKLGQRFGLDFLGNAASNATTTTNVVAPATLATFKDELLVLERSNVYSWSDETRYSTWVDSIPPWTVRATNALQSTSGLKNPVMAINTTYGVIAYAWVEGGSTSGIVYTALVDETTGAFIFGPTVVDNAGANPKLISLNNYFVLTLVSASGSANIFPYKLNLASRPYSWSAGSAIATDKLSGNLEYEITPAVNINSSLPDAAAAQFLLSYENNSGGANAITNKLVTGSTLAVAASNTVNTGAVTGFKFGSFAELAGMWVAYSHDSSTSLYVASLNTSTLAVVNSLTLAGAGSTSGSIRTIDLNYTGSAVFVSWSDYYAAQKNYTYYWQKLEADITAVSGSTQSLKYARPTSRMFYAYSKLWQVLTVSPTIQYPSSSAEQASLFLYDLNIANTASSDIGPKIAASLSPGTGNMLLSDNHKYPALLGSDASWYTLGCVCPPGSENATITKVRFSLGTLARQTCELGSLTYIASSVPLWYDSQRAGEVGFIYYPYLNTSSSSELSNLANGSLDQSSSYSYGITYFQVDSQGNKHISSPFSFTYSTNATANTVVMSVRTLAGSRRFNQYHNTSPPAVEIYRTGGGGSVLRRVTPEVAYYSGVTASSLGTMQMRTDAATSITYTDTASDSSIATTPFLYTTGGVLDNVHPPASSLCCVHKGRVWFAGCPDRREIWYSKQYTVGEAPGFNEELTIRVEEGGDITAIASLDDKLVVFKKDRIFYVVGDGPTDSGAQNDLSEPIKISNEVGCIDPNSVVLMPDGLMFRSTVGIYLLDRSLRVVYVGAAVEDLLSSSYTVLSANVVKNQTQVRFICSDTSNSASFELRYDYRAGGWTTAKYWVGSNSSPTYGGLLYSATVSRDQYYIIDSNGNLWRENTSSYVDSTKFVPQTIEFGALSVAGTQGYQSVSDVQILFDKYTDCNVTMTVTTDGTYTDSMTSNTVTLSRYQITKHLSGASMKCQSARVKIETAAPASNTGNGRAISLVSVAYRVGALEGPFKQLSSNNKG